MIYLIIFWRSLDLWISIQAFNLKYTTSLSLIHSIINSINNFLSKYPNFLHFSRKVLKYELLFGPVIISLYNIPTVDIIAVIVMFLPR